MIVEDAMSWYHTTLSVALCGKKLSGAQVLSCCWWCCASCWHWPSDDRQTVCLSFL